MCQLDLGDDGCMLVDVEDSLLSNLFFGGLFTVSSKAHSFEMAHFWIDVLRSDDFVLRLALRFNFELARLEGGSLFVCFRRV